MLVVPKPMNPSGSLALAFFVDPAAFDGY